MKLLVSSIVIAVVISLATSASLPDTPERKDNMITQEATPKGSEGDDREGKAEDQEGEPFEIIVPVARNFSSLEELFRILREDEPKEARGVTRTPQTYVKGTERNSSEYLIFLTDGVGKE